MAGLTLPRPMAVAARATRPPLRALEEEERVKSCSRTEMICFT